MFRVAIFVLLAMPLMASAHGIGIEAKLKDGRVQVEAFYDDDTPSIDAKVTIEDEMKTVIQEGRTDQHGVWSFATPKPGKYTVRVNAGDGHIAKTTITIPEAEVVGEKPAPISDGPTRADFTGPMRWVLAAVGLMLIGGLTFLAKRLSRKRPGN